MNPFVFNFLLLLLGGQVQAIGDLSVFISKEKGTYKSQHFFRGIHYKYSGDKDLIALNVILADLTQDIRYKSYANRNGNRLKKLHPNKWKKYRKEIYRISKKHSYLSAKNLKFIKQRKSLSYKELYEKIIEPISKFNVPSGARVTLRKIDKKGSLLAKPLALNAELDPLFQYFHGFPNRMPAKQILRNKPLLYVTISAKK